MSSGVFNFELDMMDGAQESSILNWMLWKERGSRSSFLMLSSALLSSKHFFYTYTLGVAFIFYFSFALALQNFVCIFNEKKS